MSSYIASLINPKTGKLQKALCLDDFYGRHSYGYCFRKDGKNVTWNQFRSSIDHSMFEFYTEDELAKINK